MLDGEALGLDGVRWALAEEVPVEVGFAGRAWTVTMASPSDLEDLAVGLALSERALVDIAELEAIRVAVFDEGIAVDLQVADAAAVRRRLGRRSITGVTGCGLCGVETLGDVALAAGRVRAPDIAASDVQAALEDLRHWQPMNARCRTLHAAAWCDPDGIRLAREDLGRHNALDKVIGALMRGGEPVAGGFVVVSSRCSYELVRKCVAVGIGLLVSVSAPTAMAVRFARDTGLRLLARDSAGGELVELGHGCG